MSRDLPGSRPSSARTRTGATAPSSPTPPSGRSRGWTPGTHALAHARDKVKELKAVGAENLPSKNWDRNSAWLQLAGLAASLNAWLRHLALEGDLAAAEPKTLRYRLLGAPARHITHARKRILKIPPGWAWASDLAAAWDRLQALHPA